jgi:hypothetical protein
MSGAATTRRSGEHRRILVMGGSSRGSSRRSTSRCAVALEAAQGDVAVLARRPGASAGAQLGRDRSLGAIEHRERPGDRLGLAARVIQRGTVEHLDLVLWRRARDLG